MKTTKTSRTTKGKPARFNSTKRGAGGLTKSSKKLKVTPSNSERAGDIGKASAALHEAQDSFSRVASTVLTSMYLTELERSVAYWRSFGATADDEQLADWGDQVLACPKLSKEYIGLMMLLQGAQ